MSGSPSGDWGKTAAAAEGPWTDPHPAVQGLSQSSPSRISQTDPAQAQCISLSIVNSCARDNAPSCGCPAHHSRACSPSNVAACGDVLGTEAWQPCPFAGSFAGTKLALPGCQPQ